MELILLPSQNDVADFNTNCRGPGYWVLPVSLAGHWRSKAGYVVAQPARVKLLSETCRRNWVGV